MAIVYVLVEQIYAVILDVSFVVYKEEKMTVVTTAALHFRHQPGPYM